MFQVFSCHFELISGLLANPKCELGEVEKAMIQVVAWHSQLILGPKTSPKGDELTGYRPSQSPLLCKPSRTFYGRRKYLSTHFLKWSLLWRLVLLYLRRSQEGDETDRGFRLGRLVWSTNFDLVFVRGRISLRCLASRKKNATAWKSVGAWTV